MRANQPVDASRLVAFARQVYGREGVAAACIGLQDDAGVDVNLLLLALYAGHCGVRLAEADLAEVDATVGGWRREVVLPLRAVRRRLSQQPHAGELRSAVLAAEIAAEEQQLRSMEALRDWPEGAPDPSASQHNLALVLRGAGIPPGIDAELPCTVLLAAVHGPGTNAACSLQH